MGAPEYELYPAEVRMTRLRQAIPGRLIEGRPGDCWRTCIACLIGAADPEEVPHFVEQAEQAGPNEGATLAEHWLLARRWLRRRGLDLGVTALDAAADTGIPYMLSVPSHRGPWGHVVIAQGREVIWDPSGLDDYRWEEHDPAESDPRMLVLPYEPDPDTEVARWRSAEGEAA